jgi:hypothetical protein
MAPWTFNVKFSCGTQFTFGSLMFPVEKDGNLELVTQGPALKQLVPVYGHVPYLSVSSSILGGACSGLNPYAGPYHRATKTTQGISIGAPIFKPFARTSSSFASTASPDQDSTDDYPEIEAPVRIPPMRVALSPWWTQLHRLSYGFALPYMKFYCP